MLYRCSGSLGRFQKCVASVTIGTKVLVEMVSSRDKIMVDHTTLRPYSKDLDGTLVSEDTSTTSPLERAPPATKCDWTTGLAARALKGVDMRRPGVRQAALLLSRGRRPRTIKGYESKFERFCYFCEDEQIFAGYE